MDVENEDKVPVFVEAQAKLDSRAQRGELVERIRHYMATSLAAYRDGKVDFSSDAILVKELDSLEVTDVLLSKSVSCVYLSWRQSRESWSSTTCAF